MGQSWLVWVSYGRLRSFGDKSVAFSCADGALGYGAKGKEKVKGTNQAR